MPDTSICVACDKNESEGYLQMSLDFHIGPSRQNFTVAAIRLCRQCARDFGCVMDVIDDPNAPQHKEEDEEAANAA